MAYWLNKHINATGVSTVSISGAGILHGIVLNQQSQITSASNTTNMITIYDATTTAASTDARIIGICQAVNSGAVDYVYDTEYMNGLTIQVGSAVAPIDITVLYR